MKGTPAKDTGKPPLPNLRKINGGKGVSSSEGKDKTAEELFVTQSQQELAVTEIPTQPLTPQWKKTPENDTFEDYVAPEYRDVAVVIMSRLEPNMKPRNAKYRNIMSVPESCLKTPYAKLTTARKDMVQEFWQELLPQVQFNLVHHAEQVGAVDKLSPSDTEITYNIRWDRDVLKQRSKPKGASPGHLKDMRTVQGELRKRTANDWVRVLHMRAAPALHPLWKKAEAPHPTRAVTDTLHSKGSEEQVAVFNYWQQLADVFNGESDVQGLTADTFENRAYKAPKDGLESLVGDSTLLTPVAPLTHKEVEQLWILDPDDPERPKRDGKWLKSTWTSIKGRLSFLAGVDAGGP